MIINFKCFSSLHNADTCRHDRHSTVTIASEVSTVRKLAGHVQIPEQDIALVFLNGRRAGIDDLLSDGDRVAFVPATGGM